MLSINMATYGFDIAMLLSSMQFAFALLLGYVFFVAGYHKLTESDRFVRIIREYDVLPTWAEKPALYILGLTEIAAFVLLLSPYSGYGALAAVALLALYIVVMARTLIQDIKVADCGCGLPGNEGQLSSWLIVRNLLLTVLAASLLNVSLMPSLVWAISIPLALFLIGSYVVIAQIHQNQIKLNVLRDYLRDSRRG